MLVTNSSLNEDVDCASKGVEASPDFESTIADDCPSLSTVEIQRVAIGSFLKHSRKHVRSVPSMPSAPLVRRVPRT